jgi:hypothetical protein
MAGPSANQRGLQFGNRVKPAVLPNQTEGVRWGEESYFKSFTTAFRLLILLAICRDWERQV